MQKKCGIAVALVEVARTFRIKVEGAEGAGLEAGLTFIAWHNQTERYTGGEKTLGC